jgi:hypothetical protein
VPFSVESGCKDTTFFQTAKFFFELFFRAAHEWFVGQRFAPEKNFSRDTKKTRKIPQKRKKHGIFHGFWGVRGRQKTVCLRILLFFCYLWHFHCARIL